MRGLTVKQKKALITDFENCVKTTGRYPRIVEDLDYEQVKRIETMNDSEIFWQEADRFLNDLARKYIQEGKLREHITCAY